MVSDDHITTFNRITRVSRETINSLKIYESHLIESNKGLNLIGKSTINQIWIRHFLDSFQVIDFIDKNEKTLIDIGSGAGFPGLVLAIASLDRKIPLKIKLIEKSPKKVIFLKKIIHVLNLNTEVHNQNVFEFPNTLAGDVFVARAFKPLKKILELMHKKGKNWKKIFIYLGKTGQSELDDASKIWDIKYKQRMSVTSKDSLIIEINKLAKR